MRHARHPDAYDREVGLRVRTLRLSRRMSQNDLGQNLGITFQQIQKYENGASIREQVAVIAAIEPLASEAPDLGIVSR